TVFVASQPTQLCVVVLSTAAPTFTSPLSLHDPLPISLAGTVTEGPTVAALRLLLASVTTAPPAGAPLLSVTVPVLPAGPVTAVGFTVTLFKAAGGFTVSVAGLATTLQVSRLGPTSATFLSLVV